MTKIKINDYFNSNRSKPLIIAEISGNHNNSIAISKKLITKISESGAQMVKFQTFLPNEMTFNLKKNIFKISNKKNPW